MVLLVLGEYRGLYLLLVDGVVVAGEVRDLVRGGYSGGCEVDGVITISDEVSMVVVLRFLVIVKLSGILWDLMKELMCLSLSLDSDSSMFPSNCVIIPCLCTGVRRLISVASGMRSSCCWVCPCVGLHRSGRK